MTGALTFYESDGIIDNCTVSNNTCEDGLNIIRSNFYITSSLFSNTFSDAFDSDFSKGIISNCYFYNTGNDAIDVSGTQLTINDLTSNNIGDKAISCGEQSRLDIHNISINHATVGIASKDMAEISGENIIIKDTMIGMSLYQKKIEFGPAFINVYNVELQGNIKIDYLIEKHSVMRVDGDYILPRSETKESIIFDKMINGEPLR